MMKEALLYVMAVAVVAASVKRIFYSDSKRVPSGDLKCGYCGQALPEWDEDAAGEHLLLCARAKLVMAEIDRKRVVGCPVPLMGTHPKLETTAERK